MKTQSHLKNTHKTEQDGFKVYKSNKLFIFLLICSLDFLNSIISYFDIVNV